MSQPEIFIIESLDFKDERAEHFEGRIISQILALSGKKCEYCYIRTKRELKALLEQFKSSHYRSAMLRYFQILGPTPDPLPQDNGSLQSTMTT